MEDFVRTSAIRKLVEPVLTKRDARRLHAKKRAKQRYDLDLDDYDLDQMVYRIRNGFAQPLRTLRKALAEYEVEGPWGILCLVVYDRKRHEIVTFIGQENWTRS